MSKYRLIFALLLLLASLNSCRPGKVLSRSEMTDVLYDLHLAEALAGNSVEPVSAQWKRGMNDLDFRDMVYQSVLQKHGITEETFYASVGYYSKNLRLYTKIYAAVDERLQDYMTEIESRKYTVPTLAQVLATLKMDTLQLRERYEFTNYRPDTVPVRRLFMPADSLPSYAEWNTRQWLRGPKMKPVAFSLVSHIPQVNAADTIAAKGTVNPADTVPNGAAGKVTPEIVAVEGRKEPPAYFREAQQKEVLHDRFRKRMIEKRQSKQ